MDPLENEVPVQAPEHTETPPAEPAAEVATQPVPAEADAPKQEVPQAEPAQQPVQPVVQQPAAQYYQNPAYFSRPAQVAQSPYANSPYVMSRQPVPAGYYGYGFMPAPQVVYQVPPVPVQPVPQQPVVPIPPAVPAQMPPAPPISQPRTAPVQPKPPVQTPPAPATPPVQTPPAQPKPPVQMPPAPPKPPAKPEGNAEPEKAKPPRKRRKGRAIIAAILILVLVAGSCGMTAALVNRHWEQEMAAMNQTLEQKINALQTQVNTPENVSKGESVSGTPNTTVDGSLTPGQVFARNQQSVVLIYNEVSRGDVYTGSGFVLTEDGYVVTNYHVVEDGRTLSFVTYDGVEHPAILVGYDANNDVALLKAETTGLQAVTLGSSDDLIVGDQVVAIGNPLGELTSTLTVGYVSAKERDITTDGTTINMLQTDAAINSGNSGGPLFNMRGEVVGITTAKYSGMSNSGASIEGIGFAIPIDDVVDIFEDLMYYGYVTGGYLGVSVYTVDAERAAMEDSPMGCLVDSVTPGSCAAKAGVRAKDIIVGLGEYKVEGYTDLSRALRKFEGGDTTTITVYRNGGEVTLDITLDERPRETTTQTPAEQSDMPENGSYEDWYKYFFGNE